MSNPAALERTIDQSISDHGFRADIPLPMGAWRLGSGLVLTAATAPEIIALDTNMQALKWDHGDAATDVIAAEFTMPGDYNPTPDFPARPAATADTSSRTWSEVNDDLKLFCLARKKDADDAENADLAVQCQVYWFTPGTDTALKSLTTPASVTLPAAVAGTTLAGLNQITLDIGDRLRAEGKRILPGDVVKLVVGPNEAPGTTDLDLELIPQNIRYRRGLALVPVYGVPTANSAGEYKVSTTTRG
jgi:hypothetical protein